MYSVNGCENRLLTVPTAGTRRKTHFGLEGDFKYKSSGRFEQVQPKRDFWLLGLFVLKDFWSPGEVKVAFMSRGSMKRQTYFDRDALCFFPLVTSDPADIHLDTVWSPDRQNGNNRFGKSDWGEQTHLYLPPTHLHGVIMDPTYFLPRPTILCL